MIKNLLIVVFLFIFIIYSLFSYSAFNDSGKRNEDIPRDQWKGVFCDFQIIESGSSFIRVAIDLNQKNLKGLAVQVIPLDNVGKPLRKISGYCEEIEKSERSRISYLLFLYDPQLFYSSKSVESDYLKFIINDGEGAILEYDAAFKKTWSTAEDVKDNKQFGPIIGNLVLKDYTFLADGDYRTPDGYYVRGVIIWEKGRWAFFIVMSDVLGSESESDTKFSTNRGWLELKTGAAHAMYEAVSPNPPYLEGWWDEEGYFHPSTKQITGTKME